MPTGTPVPTCMSIDQKVLQELSTDMPAGTPITNCMSIGLPVLQELPTETPIGYTISPCVPIGHLLLYGNFKLTCQQVLPYQLNANRSPRTMGFSN